MKEIRFYCEKCGTRVRARDKVCQTCGSFFFQVRCPVCNYQAGVDEFRQGCPGCGYAGTEVAGGSPGGGDGNLVDGLVEVPWPFGEEKTRVRSPRRRRSPEHTALLIALALVLAIVLPVIVYLTLNLRGGL